MAEDSSERSGRSAMFGWMLLALFVAVPFVAAYVAEARRNPYADCCWGRGLPAALTMIGWSAVATVVLLWPAASIIRRADGGKLSRAHLWVLIGAAVLVFAVLPPLIGNWLEGNLPIDGPAY